MHELCGCGIANGFRVSSSLGKRASEVDQSHGMYIIFSGLRPNGTGSLRY